MRTPRFGFLALGLDDISKRTPGMDKTPDMLNVFAVIKEIVPSIPVSLYVSLEIAEIIAHHIAASGRMILIQKYLSVRITSTEQPHIGFGSGVRTRLLYNLHRNFIDIDVITVLQFILQLVEQRLTGRGNLHGPAAHQGTGKLDAQPFELLFLAIIRKVIDELGRQAASSPVLAMDLGIICGAGKAMRINGCSSNLCLELWTVCLAFFSIVRSS